MNIVQSPAKIERKEAEGLEITWKLGEEAILVTAEKLRRACPCAKCKEERGDGSHDTPLTPKKGSLNVISHSKGEQLALSKIWSVGNYALGIQWGDGHDDGIFPFKLLHELSVG